MARTRINNLCYFYYVFLFMRISLITKCLVRHTWLVEKRLSINFLLINGSKDGWVVCRKAREKKFWGSNVLNCLYLLFNYRFVFFFPFVLSFLITICFVVSFQTKWNETKTLFDNSKNYLKLTVLDLLYLSAFDNTPLYYFNLTV